MGRDSGNRIGPEGGLIMQLSISIERMKYPDAEHDLIRGLELDVPPRAFVSLLGPSGIGKTTLLRIIAGLEQRYDGSVQLDGMYLRKPSRAIQVLFQDDRLLPWMTAADNIKFALPAANSGNADAVVLDWLKTVGLDGKARRWPKSLSGGEAARVAIARAFAGAPRVLLLDEPFTGVDVRIRRDLHRELEQALRISPKTVLLVTHSVEDAVLLSDTVYMASTSPMSSLSRFPVAASRPRQLTDPEIAGVVSAIVDSMLRASIHEETEDT